MKVAVTGASGHIGRAVCRLLITEGHEVKALVRQEILNLPIGIQQVKGDVLDKNSLQELMEGCDAVIHSAGKIELGYREQKDIYEVNVVGTRNVLEVAKTNQIKKMVHVSSVDIYHPYPHEEPITENSAYVDEISTYYDQTKRDAHLLALEAAKQGQFVILVCPTGVLGAPDEKLSKLGKAVWDIYRGVIPAVIKGGYDFVDVNDVAKGILLVLENGKKGENYILGGEYHSLKEFSRLILKQKGKNKSLIELPLLIAYLGLPFVGLYSKIMKKPPLYDKVYLDILKRGNPDISSEKAKRELGYTPRKLEETIQDLVTWLKKNKR